MTFEDEYFEWLIAQIDGPYDVTLYSLMLYKLYQTEFYSDLPMDGNRIGDALYLRMDFEDDNMPFDRPYIRTGCDCSVLEVLVALSKRIEADIMYDRNQGDRTGLWFWSMMECLGLNWYDDDNYEEDNIDEILEIWLSRRFERDGTGGLFVTDQYENDQRNEEIWVLANRWLSEFWL